MFCSPSCNRRWTESATHVFVEPVDRALPGQIGRGFVIPFRTLAQIGCAAASELSPDYVTTDRCLDCREV
jgi:hypothetical protein